MGPHDKDSHSPRQAYAHGRRLPVAGTRRATWRNTNFGLGVPAAPSFAGRLRRPCRFLNPVPLQTVGNGSNTVVLAP